MPENGNPCASIVVEGCPSSKKRNFWVPKKTQFLGPRGEDCAPMDVGCFTQFRTLPLIGLMVSCHIKSNQRETMIENELKKMNCKHDLVYNSFIAFKPQKYFLLSPML